MKALVLAVALALAGTLAAAQERPEDRANLADLYPDLAAWNADAAKIEKQLEEYSQCRGHLGDSPRRMLQCFDLESDFGKRFARMGVYAGELFAADTGAAPAIELQQKLGVLGTKIDEASDFEAPELLAIGRARIDEFLAQEPRLGIYRHPLDDTLRRAPHTLDAKGESIVATFGLASGAGEAAYSILSNADIPWPTIRLADGKEVKLDQSAYTQYRESENRDDRKKVMNEFFGTFKTYERTMGTTFYGSLKEATVYAKVRNYPDSLARALDRNRLPTAVYDALIANTTRNLPTLHRYFKLRARMLGVKEMRYYDIYPPLVSSPRTYSVDEMRQLTLDAIAPLGPDYAALFAKSSSAKWMDPLPRPGKYSGAYMNGSAYDVHPYLLLNLSDHYDGLTTYAHEWGHAMHTLLANKNQLYDKSDYPIFLAEIASTCNEQLLAAYMVKQAKSKEEKLYYLGQQLEAMRGTFYRQAMFAEFELTAHDKAEAGEGLSGEKFTAIYLDLLKRYHGPNVAIDPAYAAEWAYIPHFYSSFYVYQYATCISAASYFARSILKGGAKERDNYLTVLKSGGSDYPVEILKRAGLDMAGPAPYQAIIATFKDTLDQAEALMG